MVSVLTQHALRHKRIENISVMKPAVVRPWGIRMDFVLCTQCPHRRRTVVYVEDAGPSTRRERRQIHPVGGLVPSEAHCLTDIE
jgi:hypothetical protein